MRVDTKRDLFEQCDRLTREELIVLTSVCLAEIRHRIGNQAFGDYLDDCLRANRLSHEPAEFPGFFAAEEIDPRLPA